MGGIKGETANKQSQQSQLSSSPKDPLEESPETIPPHQPTLGVVVTGAPLVSTHLYIPIGVTSSSVEPKFDTVTPKRPRYATAQWKIPPLPPQQQQQTHNPIATIVTSESSPSGLSPTTNPNPQSQQLHATAASSSDTASSPPHSPVPSLSAASGQETSKPDAQQLHHQFRKGKYVSPFWKPNEMLWLARAWRVQYQGGYDGPGYGSRIDQPETGQTSGGDATGRSTRGKTRADKDREVAVFLQRHGVNRDAKTAGTKWDNMFGEFRKVYEWERGGEREHHAGKSYFRLSPYERKQYRLPASFDEEVFEELCQFMSSRMRSSHSHSRGPPPVGSGDDVRNVISGARAIPPPNPFKEDDFYHQARTKQLITASASEAYLHGSRGISLQGFEASMEVAAGTCLSSKDLRRIGKIRMTWEEYVSLWAEEGENNRGRVRLHGSSFLNADELTFFDESMVACTMESFEDGALKGFSFDRFVSGQQVRVVGRRKSSSSASASSVFSERVQLPLPEPSIRYSIPQWEFQDPTEYYIGCLRAPPTALPSLIELSWYLQEPPSEELRFPLRRDVYRDLPQGKDHFFTTSTEPLDCRGFVFDILSSIVRINPTVSVTNACTRDSFIGLWDDCINRVVSKFCAVQVVMVRKPSSSSPSVDTLQDQWPNVSGFVRNFCLWRGEETDQLREGQVDPSSSIVEKLLWTYMDIPYILGYYAVGYLVTFCALCRSQDRIVRTDLYTLDLSSPSERLKALVPCYRIGGLLPLLAERCFNNINDGRSLKQLTYSDFERVDLGNGNVIEITPNTVIKFFPNKRKWAAIKEIYDYLGQRIPHAEFLFRYVEQDLALVFKPRGIKSKPTNCYQLVEALKYVTKALVALHDLSFMHRDLSWDKVMRRNDRENEWFVCGFEEAAGAPQIYPYGIAVARGRHAPEMERGLHGVKVDVWGVGNLVKTCGLGSNLAPKMLRELQNRCLEQNPENRPTAADCYHHLLQVQSISLQSSDSGGPY